MKVIRLPVDRYRDSEYNAGMSKEPGGNDSSFYVHLYQWSVRASAIAVEMVVPAIVGIGLDRLLGTVALFAILGVILGVALGFWQLIKIARGENTE